MKYHLSPSDEGKSVDLTTNRAKTDNSFLPRRPPKKTCCDFNYSLAIVILAGSAALLALGCVVDVAPVSRGFIGAVQSHFESKSKERRLSHKNQGSSNFSPKKLSADMSNPRVLNVHAVPHTHDDVGWLKTVEQYYYGLNNTIQRVSVQSILDTVVASLLEHENRTFTYVESKFFSMWWSEQTDAVKDSVRYLVANKQLSFSNGGWCMHGKWRSNGGWVGTPEVTRKRAHI